MSENERERERDHIYKLVFVRNEWNIVFLCTKDLTVLIAGITPQALMGCKKSSDSGQFGQCLLI